MLLSEPEIKMYRVAHKIFKTWFDQFFSDKPHTIRGSKTRVKLLDTVEQNGTLQMLCLIIFTITKIV